MDRLFLDQGITEQMMGKAMREHKLAEDEEYRAFAKELHERYEKENNWKHYSQN